MGSHGTGEADADAYGIDSLDKLMLYAADAGGRDLKSKVKMQKLLFLVSEAFPEAFDGELRFEAHKKGPYSQSVDDRLIALEDAGLIDLPSCRLTPDGRGAVSVPNEPLRGISDDMKALVTGLTEDELLLMIYTDYPEYRRNSEEWDRLRASRVSLARRMFGMGKVSAGRAAELAGVSEEEFLEALHAAGVRWRDAL